MVLRLRHFTTVYSHLNSIVDTCSCVVFLCFLNSQFPLDSSGKIILAPLLLTAGREGRQ